MTIRVLAAGQSNMLGRGTGGPSFSGVSTDVSVWNNVNPLGANGTSFVTASAAQAAGTFENTDRNNFAVWFCDQLARKRLDTVTLTLVARGASPIAYWAPTEVTFPMLSETIDVWTATGQAPANVFLWQQGEGDVSTDTEVYKAAFNELVDNLKSADVIDDSTIIIICGTAEEYANRIAFNMNALVSLVNQSRVRAYAGTHSLTTADTTHFDGPSLAKFGRGSIFSAYLFSESRAER